MLQKGEITKRMREAINALGLDCTYHKAQEWLNKKYGKKLVYSESTYYSIRRLMKLDQEKKSRPSISSLVPWVSGSLANSLSIGSREHCQPFAT